MDCKRGEEVGETWWCYRLLSKKIDKTCPFSKLWKTNTDSRKFNWNSCNSHDSSQYGVWKIRKRGKNNKQNDIEFANEIVKQNY